MANWLQPLNFSQTILIELNLNSNRLPPRNVTSPIEYDQGIEREAIPFLPPREKLKTFFLEAKFSISNSTFKTQLPIFNGGSAEEFLRFMYEFNHAKAKLGYTTYQKLENNLEQLLQGTANNEWSTIKGTIVSGINTL